VLQTDFDDERIVPSLPITTWHRVRLPFRQLAFPSWTPAGLRLAGEKLWAKSGNFLGV
jgi:hypothetical protein